MAFEVRLCIQPSCTGITVKDLTGFFSNTVPLGYNGPQDAIPTLATDGTYGYTTFSLDIFFAIQGGYDEARTPDYTVDLLTWPHTIDTTTGYVTWEFTFEEIGITDETLRSGWWLGSWDAIWDNTGGPYDYSDNQTYAFTSDLTTLMDTAVMNAYKRGKGCRCKCGDRTIGDLYQTYRIWRDFLACNNMDAAFQAEADYLYTQLPLCQC